jgi:hypothetical protein
MLEMEAAMVQEPPGHHSPPRPGILGLPFSVCHSRSAWFVDSLAGGTPRQLTPPRQFQVLQYCVNKVNKRPHPPPAWLGAERAHCNRDCMNHGGQSVRHPAGVLSGV